MFFAIEFFRNIASYQFLKNDWIFINHGLFFRRKYFSQLLVNRVGVVLNAESLFFRTSTVNFFFYQRAIEWTLLPRARQTTPLSDPLVEKKSCATREKHLFYSCGCYPRFARASNFTLTKYIFFPQLNNVLKFVFIFSTLKIFTTLVRENQLSARKTTLIWLNFGVRRTKNNVFCSSGTNDFQFV